MSTHLYTGICTCTVRALLLAKRNTVGYNPNGGIVTWVAHCGDHSAARRDFQGAVTAMGALVKESLQCGT